MTFCSDHAFFQLNLAAGTNQFAASGTGNITGLSYGSGNAQSSGVGQRNLYLSSGTNGTQNGNTGDGLFGANNVNALYASELTGLRQVFFGGQLCAFAEQNLQISLGNMQMTGRSLYQYFVHFYYSSHADGSA